MDDDQPDASVPERQDAPDVLGEEGRRAVALGLLRRLQTEIAELDGTQAVNAASDDDVAPGIGVSYALRRVQLKTLVENWKRTYPQYLTST